jgi:hypothetical protein
MPDYEAGNAIMGGGPPLGQQQPLGSDDQGLAQKPGASIDQMMQDPKFQQYLQMAQGQRKKKASLKDLLQGAGTIQELAAAFPKVQAIMEQRKLSDAQKKVKDIQLDQLQKRAEQAFNAQQEQQGQQGQQGPA